MRFHCGLILLAFFCCLFVQVSSQQRRNNNIQLMPGISPELLATLGPDRPQVFKTPGELRRYLEELNSFYAITGRPRFGKRYQGPPFSLLTGNTLPDPFMF